MQTILLTGITGFIAKRIAFDLLSKGYAVRGTLRDSARSAEVVAAMKAAGLPDNALVNMDFIEADLGQDAGWNAAMAGVDGVIHTASPFPMSEPKDPEQLIRPAVDGTLRVMHAAQSAGVKHVVLTSSMVAIQYGAHAAQRPVNAEDWTDIKHRSASSYAVSKTLAERAAREFVTSHPDMTLTTVHPGLVLGTPMDKAYGTSLAVVERIMKGKDPMVPNLHMAVVDIEDVSALHIIALENKGLAGQRLLAVSGVTSFPAMAKHLATAYPDRKIATKVAPKFMLRALSLFDPAIKGIVQQVGLALEVDTSATIEATGHTFVPVEETILRAAKAVA